MKIPPDYKITPKMLELIAQIDALRIAINSLKINPSLRMNLNRESILKSALYSAKIEGNPLDLNTLNLSSKDKHNIEVFNILDAYEYVNKSFFNKIDLNLIRDIHKIVMRNLSSEVGCLRTEMNAVFNQVGIAVFVPPSPKRAKVLLRRTFKFINECKTFPLVNAFLFHLLFEKIHPFMDGNGRVGRLLVFAILKLKKYKISVFPAFEEQLNQQRSDYYYYLDRGLKKTEDYLFFMLTSFKYLLERTKTKIFSIKEKSNSSYESLFPRQQEILNIINDHKMVSFDFIRRRFLKVPARTLRYDLKVLRERRFIVKIGKTRGVLYKKSNV